MTLAKPEFETELLFEQIRHLEEINRQTVEVLEQTLVIEEFDPQDGEDASQDRLLRAIGHRLNRIYPFPIYGFCLLNGETHHFELVMVTPDSDFDELQTLFGQIVENGLFAWALKEARGVLAPPDSNGRLLYLHSISAAKGVIGLFLGLLNARENQPSNLNDTLLTIMLRQAGHSLEGITLYRRLREQRDQLDALNRVKEDQLAERKRVENWILDILDLILTLPMKMLPEAIDRILSRLSELSGAKQSLVRFFSELVGEDLRHQSQHLKLPLLSSHSFQPLLDELAQKKPRYFPDLRPVLPQNFLDSLGDEMRGCCSVLFIPLVQQQNTVGFIAAFFKHDTLVWHHHVDGLLDIVAHLVMVHLRRSMLDYRLNESVEKLNHAHKSEALGHLAGGISHDFNNLLTGIIGFAELIRKKYTGKDPELERHIERILAVSKRAANLTEKLVHFAKRAQTSLKSINLHDTIFDVIAMLGETMDRRIRIETDLRAENATILADPSRVQNVLLNLCINARDAMPYGGTLSLDSRNLFLQETDPLLQRLEIKSGSYLCCRVTDTGMGIEAEILPKLFDPFFTTKGAQGGTGLGLSCVHDTMRDHNGTVVVDSQVGQGSVFSIYFPLSNRTAEPIYRGKSASVYGKDPSILQLVGEYLEELGFKIETQRFRDGGELHFSETSDLVVLDDPSRAWWSELPPDRLTKRSLLVLVGRFDRPNVELQALSQAAFLMKPFDMQGLRRAIESLFSSPRA